MSYILSIIIPVYNVAFYIRECLDSIYAQMRDSYQVICVNDGSTDNSRIILQEYKDIHKDLIILDRENGGSGAARNSGLKMASGKYVYFLDSDDYLLPNVLHKMIEFAEVHNLDIANFNVLKSDGNYYFSIRDYPKTVLSGQEYFSFLNNFQLSLPAVPVWMYLYKKKLIDKYCLRFKKEIMLGEDNHYTPKALFFAKRVMLLNIPIQFHRLAREGAKTQYETKQRVDSLLFICRDLYHFFKAQNCDVKHFYDKIFFLYINIASKILILKNFDDHIFNEEDYGIMKKCLINEGWIMHYLLLRYSKYKWYQWYIDNNRHLFIKKNLRRLSKIYWRLIVQND
jgi:glycosyltransferase involved in cell wall biosynthesis